MSHVRAYGYTLAQGLEAVGPGWHGLVQEAFVKLPPGHIIVQVKEKFGGLRIYFEIPQKPYQHGEGASEYEALLNDLEMRSLKTCEECGKPGKPGGSGWIKTYCEECRKESRG